MFAYQGLTIAGRAYQLGAGTLCVLFVMWHWLIPVAVGGTYAAVILWAVLWDLNSMISGEGTKILFGVGLGGWCKFTLKVSQS